MYNARLLLNNGRYRASISRAYYAMYYGTQALLDAKQIASRTHRGMIQSICPRNPGASQAFPNLLSWRLKRTHQKRSPLEGWPERSGGRGGCSRYLGEHSLAPCDDAGSHR
ncbi:MAG: HEPN domain-containing protein [Cyanobacteria bacterium J06631_9]